MRTFFIGGVYLIVGEGNTGRRYGQSQTLRYVVHGAASRKAGREQGLFVVYLPGRFRDQPYERRVHGCAGWVYSVPVVDTYV